MTVSLQLADRSIKYPRGIVKVMLVKVGKFIFSADFIVLDMKEDQEIPIILDRPFLAMGMTLTDVQKGQLILRDKMNKSLLMFQDIKISYGKESCIRLDMTEKQSPADSTSTLPWYIDYVNYFLYNMKHYF